MAQWTERDIPDQNGRTVVVTGASSGIGEEAARVLAAKGARVILAVRDAGRGEATRARIGAQAADPPTVSLLDMADLASVRAFAARSVEAPGAIDVLINNAGLMQTTRSATVDGFERVFGTNHLGHFALTGLLMPALLRSPAPRVVTISSIAHRNGTIDFGDLQGERGYGAGRAYNQAKLANLLFALELDRRARAAGSRLVSVAAHPGVATTGFLQAIGVPRPVAALGNAAVRVLGQDAAAGAWPGLYAAAMPGVAGGQYWGPDGFMEVRGRPAPARVAARAADRATAERLWRVSEELTGVHYPPLA